jgi:hypothetical protein
MSSVSGSSTDQHVSGRDESGDFQSDKPPAADTPAAGSSNAGINRVDANRAVAQGDPDQMADLGSAGDGEDRADG